MRLMSMEGGRGIENPTVQILDSDQNLDGGKGLYRNKGSFCTHMSRINLSLDGQL